MSYDVLLTQSAERDLETIYDYIAENDTQANANYLLDKGESVSLSPTLSRTRAREQTNRCANPTLSEIAATLADFPERGAHPQELLDLGIREYRQVHFKPYRLIYRVIGKQVLIYLIVDGRRDMQTLLMRRVLGG